MYSTVHSSNIQDSFSNQGFLFLPSNLKGFTQLGVSTHSDQSETRSVICFSGVLSKLQDSERVCHHCGQKMHVKGTRKTILRHLPFGGTYTCVELKRERLYCEHCHHSKAREIPFKAGNHLITESLKQYVEDLLSAGCFTVKAVAELAGLNAHTVASIDKARLARLYTDQTDAGPVLKKPVTYARYLAIDEFKLHDGHQFATHIVDLETGHVLWIARGKKKQVVYDFIDHVGMDWMEHVEAVACDMNSDFQEAFEERCEWISIVFDRFHIVKNFNEKVISEVRKDIQKELADSGQEEEAKKLKGSKYLLMASQKTLQAKDERGENKTVLRAENTLFGLKPVIAKTGYVKRYKELIQSNSLLFACDLVKEQLIEAFSCKGEIKMADQVTKIIDTCRGTKNKHFQWFAKLLENHFEGIISHATYGISSGKIEGINNKIKTVRRQAFGYHDDGYFFLKIIDASYNQTVKNPKSHRFFQ